MADGTLLFDTKLDSEGVSTGLNKLGGIATGVFKGIAVGVAAATTAVAGLVVASTKAYAEYEQLVGGVETLFGIGGKTLDEYAKEQGKTVDDVQKKWLEMTTGQRIVLNNAEKAYQTAGLSANKYMGTVTSFSASLIQSLGGDTKKAADQANQAVIDMSDNANKMGTNMDMIQNAYQGFAKQNYTMLDNLKLGYGGTKTEMERLLKDAEKISGIKYDISSFSDVTQAIHVMQTEMGIAGTTAKEASTTIEGSANSMKAAWENLLTGLGDKDADLSELIKRLTDSTKTFARNLLPIVKQSLNGVGQLISELLPEILQKIPEEIGKLLPQVSEQAFNIIDALLKGLNDNMPMLVDGLLQLLLDAIEGLRILLPQLLQFGFDMVINIANGISEKAPELTDSIINLIIDVANKILDNLPKLLDAGTKMVSSIGEGLIEGLPKLIDRLPEIITKIVDFTATSGPKIAQAGVDLFIALVRNMPEIIVGIVKAIPKIIKAIKEGFEKHFDAMKDVGLNLIKGLWEGISDAGAWLRKKISGFFGGVVDDIKKFFGIHSPSTKFKWIGEMCVLGLDEGADGMGDSMVKNIKASLGTVEANVRGANLQFAGVSQREEFGSTPVLNFYDTQTSPDAIYRRFDQTMTYGLARAY